MSQDIWNVPVGWVIVPAPWPVSVPPAAQEQKWLMTLTGVAKIDFKGDSSAIWRYDTFKLHLDWKSPVSYAYGQKPPENRFPAFLAEQWAPVASINSIFDMNESINAGYAVDSCGPIFENGDQYFSGLQIDVGIRDVGAHLIGVGFQVTLLGRIVLLLSSVN